MNWKELAVIGVIAGVLVWVLLPKAGSQLPANVGRSMNKLRYIGIAMAGYEAEHHEFPAWATCDKKGKALLSWRVRLLPYIAQRTFYSQFHLDEPWDSRHNRALATAMPEDYRDPSSKAPPGMTTYLGVCGKGLMFDGDKARRTAEIKDGPEKTIMIVEADDSRAVPWTKPDDWQFDPARPLAGLGHAHCDGFCVLFVDGRVHFLPPTIDPQAFHAMLTIAGGAKVELPEGK